jgi:hypothetical protein
VAVSAAGLAATGIIEQLIAVLTGSVGLLGDAKPGRPGLSGNPPPVSPRRAMA